MGGSASSPRGRRALLLLLCALFVVWCACLCVPVAAAGGRSVSRGGAARRRPPTPATKREEDDDEDDDDNDGDAWDFLSDAAVMAAAEAAKHAQQRAVTCATSLEAARVNDDFCDCADGSDEPATGACALVTLAGDAPPFQCLHDGGGGERQRVAAAFVGDGVCDCCDGSDEASGVCADTCGARRQARLLALRERLHDVQDARATRAAYESRAAAQVAQLTSEFAEVVERMKALQRAFQYAQQKLSAQNEETGAEPSEREIRDLQAMYAQLNQWQFNAYVHQKLVDGRTFDAARGFDAFVALVGQCFPFTVNEKQLKGGSSNVIPREYVVAFCPFHNVTQTEPGYAAWQRAERQSKTGVGETDDEEGEDTVQEPIIMGVWSQWEDDEGEDGDAIAVTDAATPVLFQQFDHGEPCANGENRVVAVEMLCGATNRVLSVEEPEMCAYVLQFETPAACFAKHEHAVAAAIRSLEAYEPRASIHEEL